MLYILKSVIYLWSTNIILRKKVTFQQICKFYGFSAFAARFDQLNGVLRRDFTKNIFKVFWRHFSHKITKIAKKPKMLYIL